MQERDGYGTNATTGKDVDDLKTRAVRAILDFRPSDGISFLLEGDYFKRDDDAGATHFGARLQACSPNAAVTRGWTVTSTARAGFSELDQVKGAEGYGLSLRSQAALPFAK